MGSKECYLETYDGQKEAIYSPCDGFPYDKVHAKDGSYSIQVYRGLCESKFEQSDKPTFYAC